MASLSSGREGLIRYIVLGVTGGLLGLVVGLTYHAGPTEAQTIHTRAWSCQGRDFMPLASTQDFDHAAAMRNGHGYFQCDADIPHKAVVTRVRFTVFDNDPLGEVRECALVRITLSIASGAGNATTMALAPATGNAATPGNVRLSDTSITSATIDRLTYAYYVQCQLTRHQSSLGLWGGDVTYQISSTNG